MPHDDPFTIDLFGNTALPSGCDLGVPGFAADFGTVVDIDPRLSTPAQAPPIRSEPKTKPQMRAKVDYGCRVPAVSQNRGATVRAITSPRSCWPTKSNVTVCRPDLTSRQTRGKGRSRFDRDNVGRFMVISAIQPPHHLGFVECIAPLAERPSTRPFMQADEQRRNLVVETANMRAPQASLAGTGRQVPRQWRPLNRTGAKSSRRSTEPWHAHDAGAGPLCVLPSATRCFFNCRGFPACA